jgi:hypothetical protein
VVGDVFLIYDMTLDLALALNAIGGGIDISDGGTSGAIRFLLRSDAVSTVEVDLYSPPEASRGPRSPPPGSVWISLSPRS